MYKKPKSLWNVYKMKEVLELFNKLATVVWQNNEMAHGFDV